MECPPKGLLQGERTEGRHGRDWPQPITNDPCSDLRCKTWDPNSKADVEKLCAGPENLQPSFGCLLAK